VRFASDHARAKTLDKRDREPAAEAIIDRYLTGGE
jgi:hypothetical protein